MRRTPSIGDIDTAEGLGRRVALFVAGSETGSPFQHLLSSRTVARIIASKVASGRPAMLL
jgi:hypothetical protein